MTGKLPNKDVQAAVYSREYFGRELSQESLEHVQETNRESLEMYEFRLLHDCTIVRPEWYFQRRPVPRLQAELIEYAEELWSHGQNLLETRRNGRWVKNPGACMNYNTPCKFLGICSGHDTPDSDNWQRKECVHNELPIEEDGRDILTNSRIRCFQTCPRKHQLAYELGIDRRDEEERDALYFGSLWHKALEVWFSHFMESDND